MASGDDLRDAVRLARECMVMGRAVALGQWIGTSPRPVTAGQVLRKAEAEGAAAGAALGVLVPPRGRTMADGRAVAVASRRSGSSASVPRPLPARGRAHAA